MKKKYIIGLILILIFAAVAVWYFYFREKAPEYKEHEIKKGKITIKVLSTGTVQPLNRLQIKSPISGRVDSILVVEGQNVKKGQVLAWISSTERAVLLDSARAQSSEEVKKWEDIYKPTPILAPLSGMIILRGIEPGQTFSSSDAIFVMSDKLAIKAQVDESDLAQIHVKQKARVTLDAYSEEEFKATVEHVAFEAKTANNVTTYVIDVIPNEKNDFLRSGMTANVTFVGETREDILVIPNEYIKYDNGKPNAQVKVEGKPQIREIQLGITDGKRTEITGGLTEGEIVLLESLKKGDKKSSIFQTGGAGGGQRRGR